MLKDLTQFILKLMAQMVIRRYHPKIVAITGSVGKTTTKEVIFQTLTGVFTVARSQGSYNNEVGVPLTVLGADSGKKSLWRWLLVLAKFIRLMAGFSYPQVLVVELAADRRGDIRYLTSIVPPDVAVVTRVGHAHLEFFGDVETVQREKAELVGALGPTGIAVLNYDDSKVLAMKQLHSGRSLTYGLTSEADIQAKKVEVLFRPIVAGHNPISGLGMRVLIREGSRTFPVFLSGFLGLPFVYSILAGYAVGRVLGMTPQKIAGRLAQFQPLPGRLRLLFGIKNTVILDDSYNSSPEAAAESLRVLRQIRARRRVAVLGDMLELGPATEREHRKLGREVVDFGVDLLLTVGQRARFIADEARARGFAKTKIFEFDESADAGLALQRKMQEGDAVLIKGSQGIRMEKIVLEVMAEPERAEELLVRQDESWKNL